MSELNDGPPARLVNLPFISPLLASCVLNFKFLMHFAFLSLSLSSLESSLESSLLYIPTTHKEKDVARCELFALWDTQSQTPSGHRSSPIHAVLFVELFILGSFVLASGTFTCAVFLSDYPRTPASFLSLSIRSSTFSTTMPAWRTGGSLTSTTL